MEGVVEDIVFAIDLFGTASFAFSGALRVLDRKPDIVGMLILAGATAGGGSILRDVILGRPAVFFYSPGYTLVVLLSVIVTFFFPSSILRNQQLFAYCDAVGFGIFSALSANYAWGVMGYNPLVVIFIVSLTGCAGGVVRDLIIQKPTIVLSNELYLTPVILGAIGLMIVRGLFGFDEITGFFTAFLITIVLRIGAIRYDWRMPRVLTVNQDEQDTGP
ncbi:MAG: trimeric intracellular cation channel family protein [Thermoguttaceae bacterium]